MAVWEFDSFRFDEADGRLSRHGAGEPVHLRPQVARLLELMLERAGDVVGRDVLCRAIWGPDTVVDFDAGLAALVRELRRSFGTLGAEGTLLETVPRRGLRLNTEARHLAPDGQDTRPAIPPRPVLDGIRAPLVAVLGGLLLVAAGFFGWWWTTHPADPVKTRHALAIMPLQVVGPSAEAADSLGILLADNLLAELWGAELATLDLIGRTSMGSYAGRDDLANALANDLGVDLVLEGSAEYRPGRWRIVLRLLAVPPGEVIWSRTQTGNEEPPGAAVLARDMVEQLSEAWPAVRARVAEIRSSGRFQ